MVKQGNKECQYKGSHLLNVGGQNFSEGWR